MIKVTENLGKIYNLLSAASVAAGRPADAVLLLAVSKRQPLQAILDLADAGQRHFGENFVQEGIEKILAAGRPELIWHFIGHLQSNKTRQVAENFHWVHTIDRFKVAKRLSDHRPAGLGPLNVCLQVNIDDEDSKSGIPVDGVAELAAAVADLPRLRLRGLMCIPRACEDPGNQRLPFRALRTIREELNATGMSLDTLSMGMTADYPSAIQEGATIVRIGTALFGPRD